MKQRVLKSIEASIEWRLIAFVITGTFLYITNGEFWSATVMAFLLQLILFICHTFWFYLRHS